VLPDGSKTITGGTLVDVKGKVIGTVPASDIYIYINQIILN
jgi:hypothetical protein